MPFFAYEVEHTLFDDMATDGMNCLAMTGFLLTLCFSHMPSPATRFRKVRISAAHHSVSTTRSSHVR